jgi:exodeoxyribonuclease VIII
MREGTAFHMALHEPERFAREYVEIPNMPLRSKDNRRDFLNTIFDLTDVSVVDNGYDADGLREHVVREVRKAGSNVLTSESIATLRAMARSLNMECHKFARSLVASGKKEWEIRWKDADSGLECKALLDSYNEDIGALTDLKRTDSITKRSFRYKVIDMGYDYQMSWYRRALRSKGIDPRYCGFVCGCPTRPNPWAVYDIPVERLDWCDNQHSMYLLSMAECLAKNEWPSINNGEPTTLEIRTEQLH